MNKALTHRQKEHSPEAEGTLTRNRRGTEAEGALAQRQKGHSPRGRSPMQVQTMMKGISLPAKKSKPR